jgi:hypothetical protein
MSEEFYVNYTVDIGWGCWEDMQAGPYHSRDTAEEHKRDIAGYVAISKAWVSGARDPRRKLIS